MTMPHIALLGSLAHFNDALQLLQYLSLPYRAWLQNSTDSLQHTCEQADFVIIATSIGELRGIARMYGEFAKPQQVVVHMVHGVETGFVLPNQILREETCIKKIGMFATQLRTQNIAADNKHQLNVAVIASRFEEVWLCMRDILPSTLWLLRVNADIVGTEIAAAMSHVVRMSVSIARALDYGDTVIGFLRVRILMEAAQLGVVLGAKHETFVALASLSAMVPYIAEQFEQQKYVLQQDAIHTLREVIACAHKHQLTLTLFETILAIVESRITAQVGFASMLQLGLDGHIPC